MEKKLIVLILTALFFNWHWFEPFSRKNNEGIRAYNNKLYNEALEKFLSAKGIKPESVEIINNTASALYNLKKYQEALDEFSSIDPKKTGLKRSEFYYNTGNTYFRLNKFSEALKNYKKSLLADPNDINTKKNFELTQKKIQDQKKKKDDKDKKEEGNREKKERKHENILNYLNQKEKEQMKKIKKKAVKSKKIKDW